MKVKNIVNTPIRVVVSLLVALSTLFFTRSARANEFPEATYYNRCVGAMVLHLPELEWAVFYKTLNNFGYMQKENDEYSLRFIEHTVSTGGIGLDIGTAFGVASLAVLNRGGRIISSDIGSQHLDILSQRILAKNKANYRLYLGGLPHGLAFPDGSINSILASRVFHFLTGDEVQQSLRELYRILAPKGRVYVTAETPFLKATQAAGFIETYATRKAQNKSWPGLTYDVHKIYPSLGENLPRLLNYMDPDILTREFIAAGFKVLKVGTFARPEFPEEAQLDGRESVGIIAEKP